VSSGEHENALITCVSTSHQERPYGHEAADILKKLIEYGADTAVYSSRALEIAIANGDYGEDLEVLGKSVSEEGS
jgi:hypothetical protein